MENSGSNGREGDPKACLGKKRKHKKKIAKIPSPKSSQRNLLQTQESIRQSLIVDNSHLNSKIKALKRTLEKRDDTIREQDAELAELQSVNFVLLEELLKAPGTNFGLKMSPFLQNWVDDKYTKYAEYSLKKTSTKSTQANLGQDPSTQQSIELRTKKKIKLAKMGSNLILRPKLLLTVVIEHPQHLKYNSNPYQTFIAPSSEDSYMMANWAYGIFVVEAGNCVYKRRENNRCNGAPNHPSIFI